MSAGPPQPELINSAANPLLKDVRKTLARGGLSAGGCCVIETFHLLEEARRSGRRVRAVIVAESVRDRAPFSAGGTRTIVVPDRVLDSIAAVSTSQGVVALVDPPQWTLPRILSEQPDQQPPLAVVIDGLQDPGNLGTILRSAEAFGASGLLLVKGAVSPFNSKAVRASAGSIFRVPFVYGLDEAAVLASLRQHGVDIYAAVPAAKRGGEMNNSLADADLTRPCAIVIGSEGHGISATIRSVARDLSIPTAGVESLNAAVSAAVLLYEARRQRVRSR